MDLISFVPAFLAQFAPQVPTLAVFFAGIVIAAIRYSRHPQVSRFTLIGLVVLLVWQVLSSMLFALAPTLAQQDGWSIQQVSVFYSVIGVFGTLITTGAWICVLVALFGWRAAKTESSQYR